MSGFISADTLARLRVVAERSMTDTCKIEREDEDRDVYGAVTHGRELVSGATVCRLIPLGQDTSTGAQLFAGRETMEEQYRLIVPAGTELAADYIVTVNEVEYQVLRLEQALTDGVMVQAMVTRNNG